SLSGERFDSTIGAPWRAVELVHRGRGVVKRKLVALVGVAAAATAVVLSVTLSASGATAASNGSCYPNNEFRTSASDPFEAYLQLTNVKAQTEVELPGSTTNPKATVSLTFDGAVSSNPGPSYVANGAFTTGILHAHITWKKKFGGVTTNFLSTCIA